LNDPFDTIEWRRAAALNSGLKLLLLTTFTVAYLNPMLRASEESVITVFRVILPVVAAALVFRYFRQPLTWRTLVVMGIAAAYSLAQIAVFDLSSDTFVWSYLVNIVALILFVYFVFLYLHRYGSGSLYRHLYFWYVVLIVASIHQLLTEFAYPVVPFKEGVARIFYGQENDASLAIAAFMPVLLSRARRDPLALLLFVVGACVIYINGTRGVLIAVLSYPVLIAFFWVLSRFGRRIRPLRPVLAVLLAMAIAATAWFFRDTPIWLSGEFTSLAQLLLDPLAEIAAGEKMDAELTSINLRVTLAVVGIQEYLASFGFGIGPGASTHFVREYYPGIALSMHMFPLQLLTESGWLFLAGVIWLARTWGPRLGWRRFLPLFIFFNMATFSITAGAITNYYFFACAIYALTALPAAATRPEAEQARNSLETAPAGVNSPAA
jgi:hypothetical protein